MSIWPLTSGKLLDRKWNSKMRHMRGNPLLAVHFGLCLEWIGPVVFEIWPIKGFDILTSGDLDLWPWPSKMNLKFHIPEMHLSTKFGDSSSTRSKVIGRTSLLQCMHSVRKWLSPKNTKSRISQKQCIIRTNVYHHFCTTNNFWVMIENVDFVRVRTTQNRKYIANGASDEKKMSNIFVQLVQRNPTVFVSGSYAQYFLSYGRKCRFDLWPLASF